MNIKEQALKTESAHTTKNIADLEVVFCDRPINTFEGVDSDGQNFTYEYIEQHGENYRVPKTVLLQLRAIEEGLNASGLTLKNFKVHKSGTGRDTKYQVIALENEKIDTVVEDINNL